MGVPRPGEVADGLLAVLLCHANRTVPAERLLDELWGEGRAPQSAAKLLQTYVSRLRQSLGDASGGALITDKQGYKAHGYRLVVEAAKLDAHRFEQLVEEGRRGLDREASPPRTPPNGCARRW